jgi:hypothetical protein
MSDKQAVKEPKTPIPKDKEDTNKNQGGAQNAQEPEDIVENLEEYIEKEVANDKKIENDHQTVLVVANYMDKNPQLAKYYDYLVDWRSTSDASNENFHAKFRLKPNFRRDMS